ncbi:MAG: M20 family metallopeptidase [Rhodospirillaceae bacterium]|nr:M20 family metallopeptidase [Rhodospirillaceae bacterium]
MLLSPIPLLERLVAVDTQNPPGWEKDAAHLLGEEMQAFGMDVMHQEFRPGRMNVAARLVNGDGPTFCFNSHMDVVPFGDGWSSPPLTLMRRGNRLFGRGACDAKGPIAAMVSAARALAEGRSAWRGTLMAVFVADEEASSEGAKRYVQDSPPIDFAVIGEPTSNGVVTAHKGSLRPLVRIRGLSAHSGTPHLGVNAVFKAARLLGLIENHAEVIAKRQHSLCGSASLTITRIAGGHADNVVPEHCDLLLDRRMVPGENEDDARREIEDLLALAHEAFEIDAQVIEWRPTTGGPTETDSAHPIVAAACAACHSHGGNGAEVQGFMGACDLVHFRSIGANGVVIGPGSLDVAHKPDEFVPVEELEAAVGIYRDVALSMLHARGATA